jgi:hypothetical protein
MLLGLAIVIGLAGNARGQGSYCGNADTALAIQIQAEFYPVKPVGGIGTLRHRDLEFHWDAAFGPRQYDLLTLDRLGITVAELPPHNPFGANLSDIHLTWEYFRADTSQQYDPDPLATIGLVTGRTMSDLGLGDYCSPDTCSIRAVPTLERGHVDHYLYQNGHVFSDRGQWPSQFVGAKED